MSVPRLQEDWTGEWLDIGLAAGGEGGTLYADGDGESTAKLIIGDPPMASQRFAWVGMHGEWEQRHGLRARPIRWFGNLRLSTDGLAAVLVQRERFKGSFATCTFISDLDGEYLNCTLVRFEIGPKTLIQAVGDIVWLAPYDILLEQLEI